MYKFSWMIIALTATALGLLNGCATTADQTRVGGDCVVVPSTVPVACTMQYDPVCGCDGVSYGNACMARGAGVPRTTPGACEENLNN